MEILLIGTYKRGIGIHDELATIKELVGTNIPTEFTTSPSDFRRLIQDRTYDLIHISGHARLDGTIELPDLDDERKEDELKPDVLASFFKNANVNYVVLNFCYSSKVAELIADQIQYVIGIDGDIERTAAVDFSKAFYGSLGGSPLNPTIIDQAFKKGQNAALPRTGNIDRYIKHTNFIFIALKAHNGKYVSADKGILDNRLVAKALVIQEWEIFKLIKLEGNKIALKAYNGEGQYVSAKVHSEGKIIANVNRISKSETFELINLEGNKIALKACNGQYVCADQYDEDKLIANRKIIDEWEKFFREDVSPIETHLH